MQCVSAFDNDQQLFIGVDGGGTWTKAAVCNEYGMVLAVSASGSANPNIVGFDEAVRNTIFVLRDLASRVAHLETAISAVCISGSALSVGTLAAATALPKTPFVCISETTAAFQSAATASRGVVTVLGTGSTSERDDGSKALGNWGWMLGDEAGGVWMGRLAARAALSMLETGERSLLGEATLRAVGGTSELLFERVYRSHSVPGQLALLAPLVTKAAANGDPVAIEITNQAVEYAWQITSQLLEPDDDVVFVGNVARALEPLLIAAAPPGLHVFVVPYGVVGAVAQAANLADVSIDRTSVAASLAELHGHLAPPLLLVTDTGHTNPAPPLHTL
jgi:N-acetylglucosamine kinase-like BadF-type ATPase